MWALSASLGWILPVIAQLVWWAVHPQPPWPHLAAAALTAVAMVVHIGVVPLWRYRVHRWEISPQAVFTRTGWLVQERRITPISRVQTVDTYRGPMDRLFGLANVTVTTASSAGAVHIEALDTDVADRVVAQLTDIAEAARRGRDMTDRPHDWHRLSPRMLLVHPVHEMLRQLPVLIGSVVLGSATGNPVWPLAALGVTVVFGVLRWFFTTYRIDDENVSLRTGILSRRAVSVPRNRIRSVQTEARLLHRLLGLTVLRVGTGQEARGEAAFELDAVDSARVPRLRALLLAESLAPVEPTGRVLARWQSSWLRYAPLSFSGLVMIGAVIGLGYQTGLAVRLPESGFARSAVDAAQRAGVVLVVAVTVLLVVGVSALLAVLFSWLTYGNLPPAAAAAVKKGATPAARAAAGARAHLRHAPAAWRHLA